MARKNKYGQFIISAAEVGTYTVCPESWRLRVIEGLENSEDCQSVEKGNALHNQWAAQNAEALFLKKGINILILLFANALVLGLYLLDYK